MGRGSLAALAVAGLAAIVGAGFLVQPPAPDVAPYEPADVLHALDAMNSFVHMSPDRRVIVDAEAAASEPGVTELDVEIARDLAVHVDRIVVSFRDLDGLPESPAALDSVHHFENGRFSSLFTEDSDEAREAAGMLGAAIYYLITEEPPEG